MTTRLGIIGFGFGAIMLLSGCATRSTDFAVRDPDAGMATGVQKGKIYVAVDDSPIGTAGRVKDIDPSKKIFVCNPYKIVCDEPAFDKLYQIVESYGFSTTKKRDEAEYKIRLVGLASVNPKKIGVDKDVPAIFMNAAKILENQENNVTLSPWLDTEKLKDDEIKKELIGSGRAYQSLMYSNFEAYNSLYTQTGKLTQTLAGGSPTAGIIGTLALPIAEAIFKVKTASEFKEGFVSVGAEITDLKFGITTGTKIDVFVASDTDQNVKDMIDAGLDTALSRIKGQVYSQK